VLIALSALLAPWLAPYDPNAGSIRLRLAFVGAPAHLLGTDEQGRDMLSRLLWGGRMTLVAGLTPVLVAFVLGTGLGVARGLRGRAHEHAGDADDGHLLRVSGRAARHRHLGRARAGLPNTLISLSIVFVPRVVRVAESATVQVKGLEYIAARGRARRRGRDRAASSARQRARPDPRVREHPGVALDHPRRRPVLPRARRHPPAAEWGLMLNALRQSIYVNAVVPALPGWRSS